MRIGKRARPIYTSRDNLHMVDSIGTSRVLTFRGPWKNTWTENVEGETITLTHNRKVVARG